MEHFQRRPNPQGQYNKSPSDSMEKLCQDDITTFGHSLHGLKYALGGVLILREQVPDQPVQVTPNLCGSAFIQQRIKRSVQG